MEPHEELPSELVRPRIPLWIPAVGLAVGFLLSSLLYIGVLNLEHKSALSTSLDAPSLVANEIGLWIGLLGCALFATRRFGSKSLVRDLGLRINVIPDIPLGFAIGAFMQIVVLPLLYQPFEASNPSLAKSLSAPAKTLIGAGKSGGEIFVGLVIVVGAPIVEEIFFRGVLVTSLQSLFGRLSTRWRDLLAVFFSGVVFALVHFEKVQFLGLLVTGWVLGYIYVRTRRLGMGIVVHATFNAVTFFALVLTQR